MTDYISRDAAIAAAFSANAIGNSAYRDVYDTVERIRMIPAADVVERKRGRWIEQYQGHNLLKCSACGHEYSDYIECQNFCGNCGAYMRGET